MNKRFFPALFLAISASLLTQPAQSDNLLIGAKGGIQGVDFEGLGKADSSLMALVQMGYQFTTFWSMALAGELEISSSLDKGEVLNRDFNLQNSAFYFSMRSQGTTYFIGKVGAVKTEVDFVDVANMDDTGVAASIGMGFGSPVGLEVELTGYSYDEMGTAVMISTGWSF